MHNIADLDWILTADIDVSAWKGNTMEDKMPPITPNQVRAEIAELQKILQSWLTPEDRVFFTRLHDLSVEQLRKMMQELAYSHPGSSESPSK